MTYSSALHLVRGVKSRLAQSGVQADALFAQAGVRRRLQIESPSAVSVCALVRQGLGLAIDRKEAVQEFLGRLPLSLPLALGGVQGLELGRQLGNSQGGLPFSVVFDAAGQVYRSEEHTV